MHAYKMSVASTNEPSFTRGRLCSYAIKSVLLKEQNKCKNDETLCNISCICRRITTTTKIRPI